MAKPTIVEQFPDHAGRKVAGYARVVASVTGHAPAYVQASGTTVAGQIPVKLDATGNLRRADGSTAGAALVLNPNSGGSADVITSPAGTVWELVLVMPSGERLQRYLAVPDQSGTVRVDAIETFPPAALPPSAMAATLTAASYSSLGVDATNNATATLVADGTTNCRPALQSLVNALSALYVLDGKPRAIFVPPGRYAVKDGGVVWKTGVSLIGAGPGVTKFVLSNAGSPTNPTPLAAYTEAFHGASPAAPLTDCTFAGFEVDGSAVTLAAYSTGMKAFVLQYMVRARFTNLYLHDCGATALGCDFLQDSIIDGVVAIGNGRLNDGTQPGGAGIGIGIGGWGASERTLVTNCIARNNGTHGIFVELQDIAMTPPVGLAITDSHCEGNRYGISDWGADRLKVADCTLVGNTVNGFNVSTSGVAGVVGRRGKVSGGTIAGNGSDGVFLANSPGPYTVQGVDISNNGQHGVHIGAGTGVPRARVINCDIVGNAGAGIRIASAVSFGRIAGNDILNNGTNTGLTDELRSGLSIAGAVNSSTVEGNVIADNQGVKTQRYGVYVAAAGSIGSPMFEVNNLNGNIAGGWFNAGSGNVTGGVFWANPGIAPAISTGGQTILGESGLRIATQGATATGRLVGFTSTGAPTTGTFAVGDWVLTTDGHLWQCTGAGSPGTWAMRL